MKLSLTLALAAAAITTVSSAICKGLAPPSYTDAVKTNPQFAPAIDMIKQYPVANWYVDCGSDSINELMATCPNDTPVIIIYGLPQKDCASSSSNGKNTNADQYKAWVQSLANKVGNRKVIYILEPNAIGLYSTGDGDKCAKKYGYQENLAAATSILAANSNAQIYADVAGWAFQEPAIKALKKIGKLGKLTGIPINTSNYKQTVDMNQLCQSYSRQTGGLHCIIDTSRNFNGSPQNEWCNARSAGIGAPPTDKTGNPLVDYYLWLKVPGESDGQCVGQSSDSSAGPDAGLFFPDGFQRLWNQGYFVAGGAPKIGQAPAPTPASSSSQCTIEANTDYYGNDLSRHPVSGDANSYVSVCCDKCSTTSGCAGFTINDGFCYLKSKLENKSSSKTAVSGSRSSGSCGATEANTDYYGSDLTRHPVSGDVNNQARFCCDKCSATGGCAGFTVNDGFCYLKSKLENKIWSATAVSGSRSSSRLRRA
ncbi:hypothetical protein SDRG_03624 [Saprolegnia diclina VS20]|uniref:Apple domain-containing protein n=1 Tax=Saprolegnia diclina (strain VS20) TaxID=1156394 RepID=T0QXL6_SAPDV|nr:hypothetical protein SDRG_03624 [Saprolegnia diclina VS20]EQC39421.1 hypothetical protein SDRG_03624 [Saprolegnia diclina VS20]|eukprot:XP_008607482.1 hypothetical protein SDRG_03624 [Saprolegnia diclina VS20]